MTYLISHRPDSHSLKLIDLPLQINRIRSFQETLSKNLSMQLVLHFKIKDLHHLPLKADSLNQQIRANYNFHLSQCLMCNQPQSSMHNSNSNSTWLKDYQTQNYSLKQCNNTKINNSSSNFKTSIHRCNNSRKCNNKCTGGILNFLKLDKDNHSITRVHSHSSLKTTQFL